MLIGKGGRLESLLTSMPFLPKLFITKISVKRVSYLIYGQRYPHPSVQENVNALSAWIHVDHMRGSPPCRPEEAYPHTLTSDFVSRINVLALVAVVNKHWKWHTGPDAITQVIVPCRDRAKARGDFHFIKELDLDDVVINRDLYLEEFEKRKKARN
jgi:hypothetical protein